jgi:hypothetical protein
MTDWLHALTNGDVRSLEVTTVRVGKRKERMIAMCLLSARHWEHREWCTK